MIWNRDFWWFAYNWSNFIYNRENSKLIHEKRLSCFSLHNNSSFTIESLIEDIEKLWKTATTQKPRIHHLKIVGIDALDKWNCLNFVKGESPYTYAYKKRRQLIEVIKSSKQKQFLIMENNYIH